MLPSVMIQVRCEDGHEVLMFPEDCVDETMGPGLIVRWECPRCTGKLAKKINEVVL